MARIHNYTKLTERQLSQRKIELSQDIEKLNNLLNAQNSKSPPLRIGLFRGLIIGVCILCTLWSLATGKGIILLCSVFILSAFSLDLIYHYLLSAVPNTGRRHFETDHLQNELNTLKKQAREINEQIKSLTD